ncbi:IPT/TIG domain-containing protein [Olivibacter jilunii]|uniref:IPT/TIG domain-containing protein n=1 Tax=Olivibacter jilunii TaxID=985016 RepID=UPI003F14DF4D
MIRNETKIGQMAYLITLFAIITASCKKEQVKEQLYVKDLTVRSIDSLGAVFTAQIVGVDRASIKRTGFVWSEDQDPTQTNNRFLAETEKPDLNGLIKLNAETGIAKNVTYALCAFVETNTEIHYSKSVSFVGQGSKGVGNLTLNTSYASWGDTLKLRGYNLTSERHQIGITMDDAKAVVVFANRNEIHFVVPEEVDTPRPLIKISINGSETNFNWFFMSAPVLDSASMKYAKAGETLTLYGKNFHAIPAKNMVLFNNQPMEVISSSRNTMQVKLSDAARSVHGRLFVKTLNELTSAEQDLTQLVHFRKLPGFPGPATIRAFGQSVQQKGYLGVGYLNAEDPYFQHYDLWEFNPIDAHWSKTPIHALNSSGDFFGTSYVIDNRIFAAINSYYPFWISFGPNDREVNGNFLPGGFRNIVDGFVIDNQAYCIAERSNNEVNYDFRMLKLVEQSWRDIGSAKEANKYGASFVIDDLYYNVTGLREGFNANTHQYNPKANTWQKKNDFPGTLRQGAVGFAINGKGYVYGGNDGYQPTKDVWEYTPETDSWILKENVVSDAHSWFSVFVLDGKAYIVGGNRYYNPFDSSESTREVWQFQP